MDQATVFYCVEFGSCGCLYCVMLPILTIVGRVEGGEMGFFFLIGELGF